jgi:hypothetical protein
MSCSLCMLIECCICNGLTAAHVLSHITSCKYFLSELCGCANSVVYFCVCMPLFRLIWCVETPNDCALDWIYMTSVLRLSHVILLCNVVNMFGVHYLSICRFVLCVLCYPPISILLCNRSRCVSRYDILILCKFYWSYANLDTYDSLAVLNAVCCLPIIVCVRVLSSVCFSESIWLKCHWVAIYFFLPMPLPLWNSWSYSNLCWSVLVLFGLTNCLSLLICCCLDCLFVWSVNNVVACLHLFVECYICASDTVLLCVLLLLLVCLC